MRVRSCFVALGLMSLATTPLAGQELTPESVDRVTVNVAGGLSRYGPHGLTGLDISMNRWLAARAELLVGLGNWTNFPDARRMTAFSVAAVASAPERLRITPYLLGGYGLSLSQGFGPDLGPLAGGGLRFRLGRFSPFVELRAQHRVGVPITIGLRF